MNEIFDMKNLRKAAEQGNADAQYQLGWIYDTGEPTIRDEIKAAEWYRKAAEQGHPQAQFELGWCYANGTGVPQDDIQAIKWYSKAAEHVRDVLSEKQINTANKIVSNVNLLSDVNSTGKRKEICGFSIFTPKKKHSYKVLSVVPQTFRVQKGNVFRGHDFVIWSKSKPEKPVEIPDTFIEEANARATSETPSYPIYVVKKHGDIGVTFYLNVIENVEKTEQPFSTEPVFYEKSQVKKVALNRIFGKYSINKNFTTGEQFEEPDLESFQGKIFYVDNVTITEFERIDDYGDVYDTYTIHVFINIWKSEPVDINIDIDPALKEMQRARSEEIAQLKKEKKEINAILTKFPDITANRIENLLEIEKQLNGWYGIDEQEKKQQQIINEIPKSHYEQYETNKSLKSLVETAKSVGYSTEQCNKLCNNYTKKN